MNEPVREVGVGTWHRIKVLTEEYRALYAILTYRLGVIDQRLPLAAGAMAALLGSSSALETHQRLLLLLSVPAACLWLHRTLLLHARSKEDVLRRIDEIERQINQLVNEELLVFQSRHPNRKQAVAGRSGFGSVLAVMFVGLLAVASSMFLIAFEFAGETGLLLSYSTYAILTAAELLRSTSRLRTYRYVKAPLAPSVLVEPR